MNYGFCHFALTLRQPTTILRCLQDNKTSRTCHCLSLKDMLILRVPTIPVQTLKYLACKKITQSLSLVMRYCSLNNPVISLRTFLAIAPEQEFRQMWSLPKKSNDYLIFDSRLKRRLIWKIRKTLFWHHFELFLPNYDQITFFLQKSTSVSI